MPEGRFTGEYEIVSPAQKATLELDGTDPRPDSDYDPEALKQGTQGNQPDQGGLPHREEYTGQVRNESWKPEEAKP